MSEHLVLIGNELHVLGRKVYRCAVGEKGFTNDKSEGDGCTPIGIFPLREVLYREDRVIIPPTRLKVTAIQPNDGWCDDPLSPDYNLKVARPHEHSNEALWRKDERYDIIVPIGYNDDPVIKDKGSAIFMHVAGKNYPPTKGCIALAEADLLTVISRIVADSRIEIRAK